MENKMINTKPPTREELLSWRNSFGRMLELNDNGTKLIGAKGKSVKILSRSKQDFISFFMRSEGEDSLGYSSQKRKDGKIGVFKVPTRNKYDMFLTEDESDYVLGSNYYVIDTGYSSPGANTRRVLFEAESKKPNQFNAFEIGNIIIGEPCRVPIIYYQIPEKQFAELRDY